MTRVAVKFETLAGQRAPDADMRVDVGYSELGFASNYQQSPLAPGVAFTPDAPVIVEIPLTSGTPKEFVRRALHDEDPAHIYVELKNPQDWLFSAEVTFEYSDGTTLKGEALECHLKTNPGFQRSHRARFSLGPPYKTHLGHGPVNGTGPAGTSVEPVFLEWAQAGTNGRWGGKLPGGKGGVSISIPELVRGFPVGGHKPAVGVPELFPDLPRRSVNEGCR